VQFKAEANVELGRLTVESPCSFSETQAIASCRVPSLKKRINCSAN